MATQHPAKRIYVAGHRGMVGSAIVRVLQQRRAGEIITRARAELDLTSQAEVFSFFQEQRIDEVYLAAAKVGGIHANNTYPAEFIYENLMVQANVIHQAWASGVRKLLFLGSSCIYPRMAKQPIKEEYLQTGKLEPTNEPYAVAKIAGIKMCESYNRQYGTDFRSVMPTNLYGPGDNYHPENSHVIPGLIRRFHEAKVAGAEKVTIWGTGTPRREFLYVDDMAEASVHVMNLDPSIYQSHTQPMESHINVGVGEDVTIRELALLIAKTVDFQGEIEFDSSRPDGSPRKWLDISTLRNTDWSPKTGLAQGLKKAYDVFEADTLHTL
jgi:GDP-L-fucose synthase